MKRTRSAKPARRRTRQLVFGFIIVLLLAGAAAWSLRSRAPSSLGDISAADPANQQLVGVGRQLYATRCAGCHGGNLEGQANGAPPLGVAGPSAQRTDEQIFAVIARGGTATAPGTASGMPAFGGSLSDGQIWALVSYIKSTWPPSAQP